MKTSDGKDLLKTRSLEIDLRKFELRKHGARIEATPKEFQIVAFLARNANEVFSKEEIVSAVWGNEYGAESVSIPVYVRRIREKIEADPSHPAIIKTIRRVGYVFNLDA